MKKLYLSKEARKEIERAMPAGIRKAYKNGAEVEVEIVREKPLYRWGRTITVLISRNGKYISSDMEDATERENVAENVVEYFIYGNRGKMYRWETKRYVDGVFKPVTEKFVIGGNYAVDFVVVG